MNFVEWTDVESRDSDSLYSRGQFAAIKYMKGISIQSKVWAGLLEAYYKRWGFLSSGFSPVMQATACSDVTWPWSHCPVGMGNHTRKWWYSASHYCEQETVLCLWPSNLESLRGSSKLRQAYLLAWEYSKSLRFFTVVDRNGDLIIHG